MDTRNNGAKEEVLEIRKETFFTGEGSYRQVRYCQGAREVANELYDKNGHLLRKTGVIPDGVVKEYYGNGTLKGETAFKDGSANGRGVNYYPGGEIFEENTFKQGRLHGPSRTYRRDGLTWIESSYRDGKLHGAFVSYHDNGNDGTRAVYRGGKLDGCFECRDRYGGLMEEGTYSRGIKQGDHRFYHESGGLACLDRYKDGKLVSREEFDEDGKPIPQTGPLKTCREAAL